MSDEIQFRSPESTPVNYILLMNQQSPGYAEIVGLSAPRRLREMNGMGFDGIALAFGGFEKQEFSVKIHLYTDEDWDAWHIWKHLLTKATAKTESIGGAKVQRAMDIWHPFLADPIINVHTVTIKDVIGPVRGDETGEWVFEIRFISALKPKASYAAIEGSKDRPMDARDREIANLSTQIGRNQTTIDALKNQDLPPPHD